MLPLVAPPDAAQALRTRCGLERLSTGSGHAIATSPRREPDAVCVTEGER